MLASLEADFGAYGFADDDALVAVGDEFALAICPVDDPAFRAVVLASLDGAEDLLVVSAADFVEAVGFGEKRYVTGAGVCLKLFDADTHRD